MLLGIDNAKGAVSTRLHPIVPTVTTRSAGEALRFLTQIDRTNSAVDASAPVSAKKHQPSSSSSLPPGSSEDGINLNASLVDSSSLLVYDMRSSDAQERFKRHLPVKLSEHTPGKILAARRKEKDLQKVQGGGLG